jgi:hypothetical protein
MRIRTAVIAATMLTATVLAGAGTASAVPAHSQAPALAQSASATPQDGRDGQDDGPTGIGLNLLCGLGILGAGSCSN